MTGGAARLGGVALLMALLAAIVTWPQASHMDTAFVNHHDVFFSIWRLTWVAHALTTSPADLFNANIFYPAHATLTYSDAMLLEGVIAAPFLLAGAGPVPVYNTLLLVGFVGSGVAMFVLARHLTGSTGAALVAGAAFTLAPYRIEHVMHLELQWVMWVPLTFWALHRAVQEGSWRFGVLAGLFLWLQVLSCVYYGVFLAMLLVLFVPILLTVSGRRAWYALPGIAVAVGVALALTLPYAWPYAQTASTLGARDMRDVVQYSARPINYLSTTSLSRLWGWTADRWGGPELRLFPGLMVILLAGLSFFNQSRRWVLLYILTTGAAVVFSLGVNTPVYQWLFDRIHMLQGLRSTSRFAILAGCGLAMLAALGAQFLGERVRSRPRLKRALVPLLLLLMVIDCAMKPITLAGAELASDAPVYRVIRSAGPGVVIELPVPSLDQLPGWDPYYALWSIHHWHPLVNGYSGYYPQDYVRTMQRMTSFPDAASIARMRAHHVRYIVVHRDFLQPDRYADLMFRMAAHSEFRSWGSYRDPMGSATLFVLEP